MTSAPRTTLLAAALAATLLAGCSGGDPGSAPPEVPAPRPSLAPASTELPEPPEGTRWVGAGRLLVAVPVGWPTVVEPCGTDQRRTVQIATDASALDCVRAPGTVPGVVVTDWSTGSLRPVQGDRRDLGGVPLRTAIACTADDPASRCSVDIGSAPSGAALRLVSTAPRAEAEATAFLDSLTLLPDGWVTVPPIELGTPVGQAERVLERASLAARLPQGDWPHYAVSTVPPAGTPVPVGSTVEVLPGDG